MNIKHAIEIYLKWKKSHTNIAYSRYKVRLDAFMNHVGAHTLLNEITSDDVIEFHGLISDYYSQGTVAYSARILKNFFSFWKGRNKLHLNPKEIIPIRYTSADRDVVTKEDFEDMSEMLDENTLEDLQKKLVIHLLWDTGMRISELSDMKISEISTVQPSGLRTAKVRTRKTMRYNLVVWGAKTEELLNKYLGYRLSIDSKSSSLFVNDKTGERFATRTFQRWVKQLAQMAMVDKKISPHSFRHGKAHHILNTSDGNIRDVQALLRHVKPESSFNYLRLNESQFLKVAERYLLA